MSGFPPQNPSYSSFGAEQPPAKSSKKLWIALGVGCFGLIVLGVVAVVGLIGGGWYMMSNSKAVTAAKTAVEVNEQIQQELGTPLTTSLASVQFNTEEGVNTANVHLAVSGPIAKGTAWVLLTSTGKEKWGIAWIRLDTGHGSRVVRSEDTPTPP